MVRHPETYDSHKPVDSRQEQHVCVPRVYVCWIPGESESERVKEGSVVPPRGPSSGTHSGRIGLPKFKTSFMFGRIAPQNSSGDLLVSGGQCLLSFARCTLVARSVPDDGLGLGVCLVSPPHQHCIVIDLTDLSRMADGAVALAEDDARCSALDVVHHHWHNIIRRESGLVRMFIMLFFFAVKNGTETIRPN